MSSNLRLAIGILAALVFAYAGYQMTSLHSQSGNTVAELFDNYMGIFSFGVALLSVTVALPRSAAQPNPDAWKLVPIPGQSPVPPQGQ